jgi:molybdopterin molybdotransferase
VIPILRKGFAIKIFTGACVPQNANAIVMQEYAEEKNHAVSISRKVEKGENIRRRGKEFKKGEIVIERGNLITPPVVGMLASMGYSKVRVYKKPNIGLIVTGNELRSPWVRLRTSDIHDSNSFTLTAALRLVGINPVIVRRTKDNKRSIKLALEEAIKLSEVVISVGGVSVGEYDFVKEILNELGVKKIFWKVAIKPGKPNYFGIYRKKLIFGLPGNPVAAMISYNQLVMPALGKMMGLGNKKSSRIKAKLSTSLKKKTARLEFVRGIVSQNRIGGLIVTPTKGQDSHMLGGLAKANCLINFPMEAYKMSKGKKVTVSLLNWNMF